MKSRYESIIADLELRESKQESLEQTLKQGTKTVTIRNIIILMKILSSGYRSCNGTNKNR